MEWQQFFRSLREAKSEARKSLSFCPNSSALWCLLGHILKDEADGFLDETVATSNFPTDQKEVYKDFRDRIHQADRCFKLAKEISAGDWMQPIEAEQNEVLRSFHFWPSLPTEADSIQLTLLLGQISNLLLRNQSQVLVKGESSRRELLFDANALLRRAADLLEELDKKESDICKRHLVLVYFLLGKTKRKLEGDYHDYVECFRKSLKYAVDASFNVVEATYRLHATRLKLLLESSQTEELLRFLEEDLTQAEKDVQQEASSFEDRKARILNHTFSVLRSCRSKEMGENAEYYFKSVYALAWGYLNILNLPGEANRELSALFAKSRDLKKTMFWNYRYTDCGALPLIESERKFVAWKCKLFRLYGEILAKVNDPDGLLSLICTVRKRMVDGEKFDFETLPSLIQSSGQYCDGLVTDPSALSLSARVDSALRFFWKIFGEVCSVKSSIVSESHPELKEIILKRVEIYFSEMKILARHGKADLPLDIPASMTAAQYCKSKWG